MAAVDTDVEELDGRPAKAEPAATRRGTWRRRLPILLPAGTVAIIALACFALPQVVTMPAPTGGDVLTSQLPPGSPGHALGTDLNGNDIVSRLLHGGQASLIVAVAVNLLGLFLGGALGALSGYLSGMFDNVIMRFLDVLIAFPALVLTLAIAQALGPSQRNTILALAFFAIPAFARIARAATLRLCELPFMAAAQLCGTSGWRILFRHIAPNIGPQLLSFMLLGMGIIIVTEGALSFLGLGIPRPEPSWGNMIFEASQTLSATPMQVVWPSMALFVTVLAFNLLGENLRSRWSSR
ncbi:MAG: ABC transporter permease [Actinomycetota bacterium]